MLPKERSAIFDPSVTTDFDSPFIMPLKFTFENRTGRKLLCVYAETPSLFDRLESAGFFHFPEARFYTAQLVSALERLHSLDVVYCRLRPQRILIDWTGYILLVDFDLFVQDDSGENISALTYFKTKLSRNRYAG